MSFFKNVKEFFHNITTNDHYAQYDSNNSQSPNRGNTPLASGRNSSQISLQNNASTTSLNQSRPSTSSLNNSNSNNNININNGRIPYRPGMRSQLHNDSQIELRNYENGKPIRDISEIWDKIDNWLDNEFPELGDDIQGGATVNDLNAFENDLNINLPTSFRESYQIHDGQVSMGKTRGLIFTYPLLDLESIAAETNIWRKVYNRLEKNVNNLPFGNQKSCPPNFINEIYYDPLWIPFVKDNVGNNIALDLNPNEFGKWGQIILFGRDYDTKFVVADSFSDFLSDLQINLDDGNYDIDEDEDLIYVFKSKTYNYFDILKMKSIRKAKNIDKSFKIIDNKTKDSDLLIQSQKHQQQQLQLQQQQKQLQKKSIVSSNSLNNDDDDDNNNNNKNNNNRIINENLPKETIISPKPPSISTINKNSFTPSKENIATNDSFVIEDDDIASIEEDNTNNNNINNSINLNDKITAPIVDEVNDNLVEKNIELAEESKDEPVEESKEEPAAEETTEETAEETTEETTEETAEEPAAEETAEEPAAEETAEEPAAEETAEEPTTEESKEEPKEPAAETTEEPTVAEDAEESTEGTEDVTEEQLIQSSDNTPKKNKKGKKKGKKGKK